MINTTIDNSENNPVEQEYDITLPVKSSATTIDEIIAELQETKVSERSGRAMDHEAEDSFERLRLDGYM